MATVNLLRNGEVKAVEVPTVFNDDDDCRVFLSYWSSSKTDPWDNRIVKPFVDAYNSGTVNIDTFVTLLNNEAMDVTDVDYPITSDQIREQCSRNGYTLAR
jgi:hypothetical protein|tara:strand:+ start:49 stop:351 length:303 start_codon:yes stop_codon:yes gene_type:complete